MRVKPLNKKVDQLNCLPGGAERTMKAWCIAEVSPAPFAPKNGGQKISRERNEKQQGVELWIAVFLFLM